ncbi:predicted protein [Thalassiosira pseudonana CCMP1335]|uniref:MORN repeat-containing protein n=1 Tax=Thalassiosira pseudonana TaxID=35128 RepID=B8C3B9_THAPS|nr:predicted protein [Thalassiosira pseudonana CCMP1335]EED92094.1 predicted protein [Thalassiosira pseudonana CCMP1335]
MTTTSNPDFLSRVESKRFQGSSLNDLSSPSAQARLLEQKKQFWSQPISLRLVVPPDVTLSPAPTWTVKRFRLTQQFLEDACNRALSSSSSTDPTEQLSKLSLSRKTNDKQTLSTVFAVSHIHHRESNNVILVHDMQSQCQTAPIVYDVIVRSAGGITQGRLLSGGGGRRRKALERHFDQTSIVRSHYDGDVVFLIHNVPSMSQNEGHRVTKEDVHRWIVDGAIKHEESIKLQTTKIANLNPLLTQLEKENKRLAALDPSLANAGPMKTKVDAVRSQMEKAEKSLEALRSRHFAQCTLVVTQVPSKEQDKKDCEISKYSWKVKLTGKKKEVYVDLIESNNAWKQAEHFVDVGGISIEKLPDGFGVYESYAEDGEIGRHRLYHGYFKEGAMSGNGTLHTDEGVYSGEFDEDEPCGKGKMKYADGITLNGTFANDKRSATDTVQADEVPFNPYQRGAPNGHVQLRYPNGVRYEGTMQHGRITGNGVYRDENGT